MYEYLAFHIYYMFMYPCFKKRKFNFCIWWLRTSANIKCKILISKIWSCIIKIYWIQSKYLPSVYKLFESIYSRIAIKEVIIIQLYIMHYKYICILHKYLYALYWKQSLKMHWNNISHQNYDKYFKNILMTNRNSVSLWELKY